MAVALRVIAAVVLVGALPNVCGQGVIPPQSASPLTPLYLVHAENRTDHLYTTDEAQYRKAAASSGCAAGDVVAWIESGPAPRTMPFRRFYSRAASAHFYTWKPDEAGAMLARGWVEEADSGNIYTEQVPGSAPLYRLGWSNGEDTDYLYTMEPAEASRLSAEGWTREGIAGYAYTTASPTIANGAVIGVRPWLQGTHPRNKAFGLHYVPATTRRKNATVQQLDFDLTTYGMNLAGDHLAVMLRSQFRDDRWWPQNNSYYWGVGAAMGALASFCPGTDWNVVLEIFDNPDNQRLLGANEKPDTCSVDMREGVTWHVTVTASDDGRFDYRIFDGDKQVAHRSASAARVPGWIGPGPFKKESTGFLLFGTELASNSNAYTAYIENIRITWH